MRAGRVWYVVAVASALAVLGAGLAGPADASLIKYRVQNHPDGGAIDVNVDADGYALRLDLPNTFNASGVNTFNANHSDVIFQWDPMDPVADTAMLHGTLFHNESGTNATSFDGADDPWGINITFKTTHLTDGVTPAWYGANDPSKVYDDMIADLLTDANLPDTTDAVTGQNERSTFFNDQVARIYFEIVKVDLTYLGGGVPLYDGPTTWTEFPNITAPLNGDDKLFFLQYRWRLWKSKFAGPDFEAIGAAGWLERNPTGGQLVNCCEDLLFIVTTKVPEPGSLALFGIGLIGIAILHRRRRRP